MKMTSRKASIVRDSCRNKSPGNRKSPHFFRKKFGNRWSSNGEHIVIRIRWSRFKSFRPVVSLQNNLLHINSPFQDLLMVTAGISTESCSVGGKPWSLYRRDRSTPKCLTLLKRKIISGRFGLTRSKSALSIFFMRETEKYKADHSTVSHLLTSETRVRRNPSPKIVTTSFFGIGLSKPRLYRRRVKNW